MASPIASRNTILNPAWVADLRASLFAARLAAETQLDDLREALEDTVGDPSGEAAIDRTLTKRAAARCAQLLVDIDDALARVDAGSYGRCERCHLSITPARLEAIPHARHCVRCTAHS